MRGEENMLTYRREVDGGLPPRVRDYPAWNVLWGFGAVVASVIGVALLSGCTWVFLFSFGPMLWLMILFAVAQGMRWTRRARVTTVLGYVEQAVRLKLPLPLALEGAARSERGLTAKRLRAMAQHMWAGLDVAQALWLGVPEAPRALAERLEAATRVGALEAMLGRWRAEERSRMAMPTLDGPYLLALLLVLGLPVPLFFIIWVVPKFREIFNDFQTVLPWPTEALISLVDWMTADWGWLVVTPLMAVLVLWIVTRSFTEIFVVPPRWRFLDRAWDAVVWWLPVAGDLAQGRGLAEVFAVTAQGLENGVALPAALRAAVPAGANEMLRRRVGRWADGVVMGRRLGESARTARLPTLAAELLGTAEALGNVPETLGFLSRYYRWRWVRTQALVRAALVPATVLLVGAWVGFVALALFLPLVQLINATAGYSPRLL